MASIKDGIGKVEKQIEEKKRKLAGLKIAYMYNKIININIFFFRF